MARTSVVIPALNEEQTVAGVVAAVAADGPQEILVIDADSADATARRAREAGARVVGWREVLPGISPRAGKGESLWRGVAAAQGQFVAFVDADLKRPAPGMIRRLVAPFADPAVALVKATYRRDLHGVAHEGGRVTELTAKPLLGLLFPQLAGLDQPLGGEYAIRRELAVQLPFVSGYGVESGLIIDVARRCGVGAIAEVALGPRAHRNRPLAELKPMARTVAATILARAGVSGVAVDERPPLASIL
ncbi:glucosyl-3-phosphoglycerate synthase [Corynebacterium atypicum]|uniref:Glucosyl-3-phosphoglycerate synthase n=1 Tax=Corynebacterium atypicum TaxID=191610 RepID=A0ABN4DDG8_9CORY|nr:glucosyl-3-phosphoglycerate synthase [Corynebacterium atypicum]